MKRVRQRFVRWLYERYCGDEIESRTRRVWNCSTAKYFEVNKDSSKWKLYEKAL